MNARKRWTRGGLESGFWIILLTISIVVTASCSKKIRPEKSVELIVYPAPPDAARIQYLTSISTSAQVVGTKSKFNKFLTGEEPPAPIHKPYGVATYQSKIYLCDLDLPGLEILNLEEQVFEYFVPKGLGALKLPINCHVDSLGKLYIADTQRKQVVIFDNELNYLNSLGGSKEDKPSDVYVKNGKIWVVDVALGEVKVYQNDSTYKYLYSISGNNRDGSKILQPTNIYVTEDRVYVSDFGDFNIKIFDYEGKLINKVGSYGRGVGQFTRPKGVAVDRAGTLYVVDAAFENVQMFSKEGQLLMYFGGSYKGPGDMWLPAKVAISYDGLEPFQKFVDDRYTLKYLILVSNNFGPDKLNVYGYIVEKQ